MDAQLGHDSGVRTAWYGRALLAAGALLTAGTGTALWFRPEAVGTAFAWEIRAPLTAAFMGAWYMGAAAALLLGLRERFWRRTRTVLVIALALTSTSLLATARFHDSFRLGEGSALQQGIAWTWLLVYAVLPPAVLAVIALHERADRRRPARVVEPHARWTRGVLIATAAGCGVLGTWLTVAPQPLSEVWPWTLNELSASIVGTWALTVAIGCAWALHERDWDRTRIALRPVQLALALLLVAVARLEHSMTGSGVAVGTYAAVVGGMLCAFSVLPLAQRRALRGAGGPDAVATQPAVE
jgi:hypothetical protein